MRRSVGVTILQWGLAFVFFYAGVASLLNPTLWGGYLPPLLATAPFARLFLTIFAVYEIVLAIWLFAGRKLRWSAIIAAITFIAIIISDFSIFRVTFRDVGLLMAALALFEFAREKGAKEETEEEFL